MEGKKTSIILISINIILSLVIAFLSINIYFSSGSNKELVPLAINGSNNDAYETIIKEPVRPSQSELSIKKLFDDKIIYNLKSINDERSVIQVSVAIEYYKKVKGIRNVEEKIDSFDSAIKELVGTYFQKMTIEEVKDPNTKLRAKKELTKEINNLLNSDEITNYNIVYDVIFEGWFYQ